MQLLCQALALLWTLIYSVFRVALELPFWIAKNIILHSRGSDCTVNQDAGRCWFYEGIVTHARKRPAVNKFAHPVRMAVVNLDDPPEWWANQAGDHMTADGARHFAGK